MPTLTLSAIRTKIKDECDLNEEQFINDTELDRFINDAIRDVEAQIHNLNEDYFLTNANIALVNGTSTYSLPSDIYADKIRLIQYDNGADDYPINKIRNLHDIPFIDNNAYYRYILLNDASNGRQIKIYPASRETSSTNVTIWYIRNAKELSLDADVCDVPEHINFVYWRVKLAVYQKEGSPMAAEAAEMVGILRQAMIDSLSERIPDNDNKVDIDQTHYEDME